MTARRSAFRAVPVLLLAACSTGQVRPPKRVVHEREDEESERETRETEADRALARRKAAEKLVPEGSSCLPLEARDDRELHLELAALGDSARICAIDVDRDRLLGPVGCWNIDLTASTLAYQEPAPLPGRGFAVEVDDKCVRGFCLPDTPEHDSALIAWSLDGKQVAVLVDRRVHLFDSGSLAHTSSFSLEKSERTITGLHHMGTHLILQSRAQGETSTWIYEIDGTQVGAVTSAPPGDERTLTTSTGALALLDAGHIGIGEHAFEELTTVDLASGAKTRITRKPPTKLRCKPAELESAWRDSKAEDVSADCRASLAPLQPLVGATVIAGRTNLLALLRGERAGQLAVLDSKTLVEKRAITLPWCEAKAKTKRSDDDDDDGDDDEDDDKDDKDDDDAPKAKTKGKAKSKTPSDDDE